MYAVIGGRGGVVVLPNVCHNDVICFKFLYDETENSIRMNPLSLDHPKQAITQRHLLLSSGCYEVDYMVHIVHADT